MIKGTIALDIDGTIAKKDCMIPSSVVEHLNQLYMDGWRFIFATGRSFTFAMSALSKLNFPFLTALHNGADLIEMPACKLVGRVYLNLETIRELEILYKEYAEDLIVYAGFEKGDLCYFRPKRFSHNMLEYIKNLEKFSASPWLEVQDFIALDQTIFPMVKCVGEKSHLTSFRENISHLKYLKTCIIKEPFYDHHLLLINHINANKGAAVKKLMDLYNLKAPLIVAGDDTNDIPLLEVGDISIAMNPAPQSLKDLADIIAPSSEDQGIIEGLQRAIQGNYESCSK